MKRIYWNSEALPCEATLDQVLYDIRRDDDGDGLLLDAVSAREIIEDADGVLALDALITPYAKLERKMELLRGIMERAGDKVKPVAMQITDPFKQRGVAQVAVIFELSDGQTVTIFFHNPDVTPNKMAAADELISWKWLLNKKDITIVVAPERGADLNVREVARRIMRLAEKNSPAFQRANVKRAERMQNIQSLKDEIAELEKELATVQHELEVAKVAAEAGKPEPAPVASSEETPPAMAEVQRREQALIDAYIKAWGDKAAIVNAAVSAVNWGGIIDYASAKAEIQKLQSAANSERPTIKDALDALKSAGVKTWDGVADTKEFQAYNKAMDSYGEAMDKIQAVAKEKLIEAGKAEFAALPIGAPLEDVARAIFRKHGIDNGGKVPPIVAAIKAKDVEIAWSFLRNIDNKASAEVFERAAGFKLANTQKGRAKQIDEWAGITVEKRAEIEAAKDAAWQAGKTEKVLKDSWGWLKSMNVRDGSHVVDGQQYLLRQFADGYDEVGTSKRGVATIYGMDKGGELSFVNNRSFNAFLKSAMAFGGLRKALEAVGAKIPETKIELTGKELGDFPDTEEGLKALRMAAVNYYDAALIGGGGVENAALNKLIEFDAEGRNKVESFSADPRKLHAVHALRSIVAKGKPTPISPIQPHAKAKRKGVTLVHVLKTSVKIDGEDLKIRFLVYEKADGHLFYDHSVDNSDMRAALGGNAEALDSADAADLNPPALLPDEPSSGQRRNVNIVESDEEFNDLEPFDENEIGGMFEAETVTLDSVAFDAVTSGMVFNLFIEGEEPEEIEAEAVADVQEEPQAEAGVASIAPDQQKEADRALFQSVIDGSVADILAPELADSLEAAFYRQQTDPELVGLFEQAVDAYQNAMMAATAELA